MSKLSALQLEVTRAETARIKALEGVSATEARQAAAIAAFEEYKATAPAGIGEVLPVGIDVAFNFGRKDNIVLKSGTIVAVLVQKAGAPLYRVQTGEGFNAALFTVRAHAITQVGAPADANNEAAE